MITLTVIAFNDIPADGSLQCQFDELGGLIGRASTNQLVLPDPERVISRVAAQVVYRNGAFAIVDRGSNPIRHNGHALGSGREVPLAPGDQVGIGGYELRASEGASVMAVTSDPFAGLLGPAAPATARGAAIADPLAIAGMEARRALPTPLPQVQGIPNDWDPFATHVSPVDKPGAPTRRDALGLDLGSAAPAPLVPGLNLPSAPPTSIDQLFGLGPSRGGDPLSNSILDAPMAQPNMAADADPQRSLGMAPRATAASQSDHLPDLQRAFIPPTDLKPPGPVSASTATGILNSWDTSASAVAPLATAPVAALPFASPAPATAPAMVERSPPLAPAPTARPGGQAVSEDGGALLEALRRGLSVPTLELPALTPELMELIGQLLHEAVRGTVDLLRARSAVKHELRAQVTTIVAKSNNPLKFSPNVEAALQYLLDPPARGFITAAPAMREAYDDLRAHQFAFVAGMQAVVEDALQRFDPAVLQGRLGDRTLLHSLLPANRNARLWELFVEHYARIRNDAADDFNTLFGQAFLDAYNEHADRLQAQRGASRRED